MADHSVNTVELNDLVDRIRLNDASAREELVGRVLGRLEKLAHAMRRDFPKLRALEQTEDMISESVMRLLRALREVQPTSVRHFFALAAREMRRVLLDVARRYRGGRGLTAHAVPLDAAGDPAPEPAAPGDGEMDQWEAFHAAVEQLPEYEREVVGLTFYHDWGQAQVAALLGISDRQVRRLWRAACAKIRQDQVGGLPAAVGDGPPDEPA